MRLCQKEGDIVSKSKGKRKSPDDRHRKHPPIEIRKLATGINAKHISLLIEQVAIRDANVQARTVAGEERATARARQLLAIVRAKKKGDWLAVVVNESEQGGIIVRVGKGDALDPTNPALKREWTGMTIPLVAERIKQIVAQANGLIEEEGRFDEENVLQQLQDKDLLA